MLTNGLLQLRNQVQLRLSVSGGSWVLRNSGYETELAQQLGMQHTPSTHWDAVWGEYKIEFKKGQTHFWLNLVRYSNYLVDLSNEEVITLFIEYRHLPGSATGSSTMTGIVRAAYLVESKALLGQLGIDSQSASVIQSVQKTIRNRTGRGIEMGFRLTVPQVRNLATVSVVFSLT